jgi:hypothetical protein
LHCLSQFAFGWCLSAGCVVLVLEDEMTILTKNFADLKAEVEAHVAADQVVQGNYWDGSRGCFIGCLAHSNDPTLAIERFGLTLPLLRIAESIFESLPADEAKAFFAALPDAIGCDGKDLSRVHWQFLAAELRALPAQEPEIQAVIDPVIEGMDLLAAGEEWPSATNASYAAADAAARAADAAAYAAADDAAYAAARAAARAADAAAYAAADAAYAAADAAADAADAAAYAAADDAAYLRQRDTLLRLIANAPVVERMTQGEG